VIVSLVTPDLIVVGNLGDSRCVVSVGGKAKGLSTDQKPTTRSESKRITAAGGFVKDGRTNGILAVSRALGDSFLKRNIVGDDAVEPEQTIVTAVPETVKHLRSGDDEFMILACDGIWDVMTNQEAVDYVSDAMKRAPSGDLVHVGRACEALLKECLRRDSYDNMSIIVVLLPGAKLSTEPPSTLRKTCRVGHDLALYTAKGDRGTCDGCFRGIVDGTTVMNCAACDYFLCDHCDTRAGVAGAGGVAGVAGAVGVAGMAGAVGAVGGESKDAAGAVTGVGDGGSAAGATTGATADGATPFQKQSIAVQERVLRDMSMKVGSRGGCG
jgi:hypothetical protein